MDIFKPRTQIRLKEYDYSTEGYYFVTICVKDHKTVFGSIEDGQMKINNLGILTDNIWGKIPDHY